MKTQQAKYVSLPSLSPYARGDRYEILKEDHKAIIRKLQKIFGKTASLNVVDVGCGNGELIYSVKKSFPQWSYTGYDYTEDFINTGRKFPGLAGVRLIHKDLFEIDKIFDLVLCSSVIQIFPDIGPPLNKLLSLCKKGGSLLIDGLFNQFDIEVRTQFCDNSRPETKGLWRVDWNQHSRRSIIELLKDNVESVEFEDVIMDKDIPLDPEMPINRFTFRDSRGRNIITNGTNMMMNRTLLTIKK